MKPTTMLAGPLHPTELYAAEGNCAPQSGLPRFREASFDGAFPFGTVHLADKDLPVRVTIMGFSPFVPGDSAASSLPVASLEYEVENLSDEPLEVSVNAFATDAPDGSRYVTFYNFSTVKPCAFRIPTGGRGKIVAEEALVPNGLETGCRFASGPGTGKIVDGFYELTLAPASLASVRMGEAAQ